MCSLLPGWVRVGGVRIARPGQKALTREAKAALDACVVGGGGGEIQNPLGDSKLPATIVH